MFLNRFLLMSLVQGALRGPVMSALIGEVLMYYAHRVEGTAVCLKQCQNKE
jgi:hypothetical protein